MRKFHRVALKNHTNNGLDYKEINMKLGFVLIALGLAVFLDGVVFGYLIAKFSQRNKR